jgi:hypothetical protein
MTAQRTMYHDRACVLRCGKAKLLIEDAPAPCRQAGPYDWYTVVKSHSWKPWNYGRRKAVPCFGQAGGPRRPAALGSSSRRSADMGGPMENDILGPVVAHCFSSVAARWLAQNDFCTSGPLGWFVYRGRCGSSG